MTMTRLVLLAACAAAALAGCAGFPGSGSNTASASATLSPTRGNTTAGTVRFTEHNGRVMVVGEVRGLKPNGEHGFHVHEKGDCSSGDGNSAGGHFNPQGQPHGRHDAAAHHVGDLPSLRADASGVARFNFESRSIAVGTGAGDIVGRGLIVHANPDDYTTQPTGNAGARLACAVIVRS
jgi:Cu-Zn family superoxide dismutase